MFWGCHQINPKENKKNKRWRKPSKVIHPLRIVSGGTCTATCLCALCPPTHSQLLVTPKFQHRSHQFPPLSWKSPSGDDSPGGPLSFRWGSILHILAVEISGTEMQVSKKKKAGRKAAENNWPPPKNLSQYERTCAYSL